MSDSEPQMRHIYEERHAGINRHDVPGVIALHAENATPRNTSYPHDLPAFGGRRLARPKRDRKLFTKTLGALSRNPRALP